MTQMQATVEHVAYRGAAGVVLEEALRLALRDRAARPRGPHEIDEAVKWVTLAAEDAGTLVDRFYAGRDVEREAIRGALIRVMAAALRAVLETPLEQ
jgi:hypothetical protein